MTVADAIKLAEGFTELANPEAITVTEVFTSVDDVGNEIEEKTNPNQPVLIADIIGPSSGDYYYHRDYKTYADHLYIVNEMYGGDIGMQVIDLSPLPENAPIQLSTYNEMSQSHNLWIDQSNELAFIEHQNGDNIHIANLSNPDKLQVGQRLSL